ncbi:MAG: hypothetical protein HQ483_15850 [Rhodospirillales bacterium]|nr:hypothetical protein [Rhodospirillales bacterium]
MPDSSAEKTKKLVETMEGSPEQPLGLLKAKELAGKGDKFEFTFEYLGFLFAVKAGTDGQKTNMRVHANFGYVPYTVEGPSRRATAMDILGAAAEHLGGRVFITAEQRIMLIEDYVIDEPLTPVLLLTKATTLILKAKPFLALMARVVNPPVRSQPRAPA